jgi:hypothetical protein
MDRIALFGTRTLGIFGEEMDYRGYLMNRVAAMLRSTRNSMFDSAIAANIPCRCSSRKSRC